MLQLLSNHDPRFLTYGLGLIRLSPTVMEHESSLSRCCRVPTNKNSVLSSLIINRSWIIYFLTASMHFSIACIASAWAVLPGGLRWFLSKRLGKKKSESQVGFEPTTLRDLVGCSNHLSYWRLYGEQGPICGSRLEPHHAATQPSNDRHTRSEELTNSIALSP